jgi:hypothetical protein
MVKITKIDPITFEFQTYETQDETLIPTSEVNTKLGEFNYLEFYIYNLNKDIIYSDLNYSKYRIENGGVDGINNIILNPEKDVTSNGFNEGDFIAYYNFFVNRIGNQNQDKLYISEISSDRTEIRLDTNQELSIVPITKDFIEFRNQQDYFVDFYLNFGNNNLIIANNIKLDNETTNNPTVVVKLYEPLPNNFSLKDQLWVVTTLNEPEAFQVSYPIETIEFNDFTQLSGPNFNIPLKNQINNSSQNLSYNDIISGAPTSSQNQINNILAESNINISVDYTDFSNFIHFSSAQTRIENFYYKVGLIETATSRINTLENISSSFSAQFIERKKIQNTIQNFDKFEHFMYYSSGSTMSYPKSNSTQPYTLLPTTNPQVLTWLGSTDEQSSNFGGLLLSASNFDNANLDLLKKSIPEYLREDPANQQYDLFIDMVAQYYDTVWLYTKDITQKYNADNRLDFGISKDLVSDAIKDFGVKLYQNNFSNKELYTAFLGLTPEGSLFPFPEITGSLPAPTGFEFVDTLISASNDVISMDDTNKSLYKRIYHNIPYLLKSKGTLAGLRALITSYGIPDTMLKISEFGGKDKVNANDYDLYFNHFNNAHLNTTNNFISSSWQVNGRWFSNSNRPSTVQFRFKSEEFPPTNLSQSLFSLYNGSTLVSDLILEYNGSGSLSGSYSGSIQDPYYQYANLKWIPNTSAANNSASIYLPFLNNDWWSVMVTSGSSSGFELHAANKIYNGNTGTSIGHITSSFVNSGTWSTPTKAYFATSSMHNGFSGSFQEIRYYNTRLSESVFKDYTMNPLSFEGNGINSAPDQLIFRAVLGSELDTSTTSIHPKITGSYNNYTQSFSNHSNFYANSGLNLKPNTETFFLDQPAVGIKNRITDKIRVENNTLPSGNTLSPIRRLSQTIEASSSYTDSVNYLEVAFSPQNQINDDIIAQMGHFNIGDYIGDPRQRFSGSRYEDLNNLSEEYFKKYIKQYDLVDFVRLIKFFDNSLFKMIKDFIPARTSLASGLVIKQHLLERNKYKQPTIQPATNELLSGSLDIATISGGPAGMVNKFNSTTTSPSGSLGQGPNNLYNITQSWSVTTPSINGFISKSHSSQDEFYNGELSGSVILVSDGELNSDCEIFKSPYFKPVDLKLRTYQGIGTFGGSGLYYVSGDVISRFRSEYNNPTDGYMALYGLQYTNYTPTVRMVAYMNISRKDNEGNDISTTLNSLKEITVPYSSGDITYTINQANIFSYPTHVSYEISWNYLNSGSYQWDLNDSSTLNYDTFSPLVNNNVVFTKIPNNEYLIPLKIETSLISGSSLESPMFETSPLLGSTTDSTVNASGNQVILNTYIKKDVTVGFKYTASIDTVGSDLTIRFYQTRNGALHTLLDSQNYSAGEPFYKTFQTTLTSGSGQLPGDGFALVAYSPNSITGNFTNSVEFMNSGFFAESDPATGGNTLNTIPDPLLPPKKFEGEDCDVLMNNVDQYPTNDFLQDIDYSSDPITPVNVNRIISGTADKGTIPESYYTSLKHTRLRYEGSKIQSSDFNVYDNDAGTSSFGDPINIGNYGQTPVIDSLDNTIVEFNWAGGTNPEIPFGGSFKLSNMLFEVNSPDDIKIIVPGTNVREFTHSVLWASGSGLISQLTTGSTNTIEERDDYYEILNNSYGAGKSLIPFEYNPDGQPILPLFTKVIESTIEVPARSTFALSSSYNGNLGDWITGSGFIQLSPTGSLARLGENYSTSNIVSLSNPDNFQNLITDDIKNGNRYFITIFNSLDFPISVTEEDQVFKYETVADKPDATELQKKGVFEIEGVFNFTFINKLLIKMKRPNHSGSNIYFGNGNKGFLIWKSPTAYKRQALIVDQRTSGVGPGGFYSINTTDTVRDNFESITKEYGSNQTG